MAILSKRMMTEVNRGYQGAYGLKAYFMNLSGEVINADDPLRVLANTRYRRNYALQQSIDLGEPYVFRPVPSVATWVMGLEHRRMVHGAVIGGEVFVADGECGGGRMKPLDAERTAQGLVAYGMDAERAAQFAHSLPVWPEGRIRKAAEFLVKTFYDISGWKPVLTTENRLKALQQRQINQAIEDQRRKGSEALYAFEKERMLLSNIRAGDRNEARRILNEMLATIYLSSPRLAVLRARAVELMSCLTRAAIEDNPLLEPLMEQNHAWTERLIAAETFEDISQYLMAALDEFIDDVYLHGVNRTNPRVSGALDFMSRKHAEDISLREIARNVGLSSCRLAHLVKEYTGKTVMQHLRQIRVRRAQHLLSKTSMTCTEIAYAVGYGDQSYFIKQFKKMTGATPARYRRQRAS